MLGIATAAPSFYNEASETFVYGNRCGHNPDAPRFFIPPEKHKLRPSVIQFAIKNLEHFYNNPKKWLYSLLDVRESTRQQRTEGREREHNIIGVILHYVDLASLRVGFPDESGDFVSLDMRFLARQVGWRTQEDDKEDDERIKKGLRPKNKGIKRTWRAIDNLKKAGYIKVCQQFKMTKESDVKSYKGLAAIRTVNEKLFTHLGVTSLKLELARKQAAKRLKEKNRTYMQKAEALVASLKNMRSNGVKPMTNALDNVFGAFKPRSPSKHQYNREKAFQQEKARQAECFELRQLPENKDMPAEAFYEKFPHLRKRE